jgi:hypothetical protein
MFHIDINQKGKCEFTFDIKFKFQNKKHPITNGDKRGLRTKLRMLKA